MRALLRPLVCLSVLLLAGPALAQSSLAEVRDTAGLFNPKTVKEVDAQLRELRDVYHRDILIETVKEVPKDVLSRMEKDKHPARVFADWARSRAREYGVHGIYVLISNDRRPTLKHAAVVVWPESEEATLPRRYCEEIRRAFVDGHRHNSPNQALVNMVEMIRDRLRAGLSGETNAALPITWMTIGLILVGVLTVWVVALAVRGRLNARDAAADQGSGKHLPGVMGGMFGTVASHWIYDKALQHEGPGETPPVTPAGEPAPPVPADATAVPPGPDGTNPDPTHAHP
jgi:hypothetical protein